MIGKRNKARRKAESKHLFGLLLKAKHKVETPAKHKGTKSENNAKAIRESKDND